MNFTESFQEFSGKLGPMDLALYGGVGIILWVLFKDKISPIQSILMDYFEKLKGVAKDKTDTITIKVPDTVKSSPRDEQDLFFDLVVSWKQTRDLAVKSGCAKAVKVADEMFPYLSPTVCSEEENAE